MVANPINPYEVWWMDVLATDERDRLERCKRRWDAYAGRHPASLKVRIGGPDDNVTVNLCRAIVDKGVSFLFGEEVGFELQQDDETPAEDYLDAVWRANDKMTMLQELATSGGVTGHVFVRLYVDGAGTDRRLPRMVVMDPEMVHPTWDQDDIGRVINWRIQYNAIDPATRKPIVRRTLIDPLDSGKGWAITDQVAGMDRRSWQTTLESVWPYPWAPIEHCKNLPNPHEFWGESDLEDDLLSHQGKINFLASNMLRIIRNHAHPKTYLTGLNGKDLDTSPDKAISLPNGATIGALEMQSDLASSQQFLGWLVDLFGVIGRVPLSTIGSADIGSNLSGLALKIKYQPLLEKTMTKRMTYGGLLDRLNLRLLELGKQPTEQAPELVWPDLLPTDPIAERQAAKDDVGLGFSQDTIIQRLGGNPAHERERRTQDQVIGIILQRAQAAQALIDTGANPVEAYRLVGFSEEDARLLDMADLSVTDQ